MHICISELGHHLLWFGNDLLHVQYQTIMDQMITFFDLDLYD